MRGGRLALTSRRTFTVGIGRRPPRRSVDGLMSVTSAGGTAVTRKAGRTIGAPSDSADENPPQGNGAEVVRVRIGDLVERVSMDPYGVRCSESRRLSAAHPCGGVRQGLRAGAQGRSEGRRMRIGDLVERVPMAPYGPRCGEPGWLSTAHPCGGVRQGLRAGAQGRSEGRMRIGDLAERVSVASDGLRCGESHRLSTAYWGGRVRQGAAGRREGTSDAHR